MGRFLRAQTEVTPKKRTRLMSKQAAENAVGGPHRSPTRDYSFDTLGDSDSSDELDDSESPVRESTSLSATAVRESPCSSHPSYGSSPLPEFPTAVHPGYDGLGTELNMDFDDGEDGTDVSFLPHDAEIVEYIRSSMSEEAFGDWLAMERSRYNELGAEQYAEFSQRDAEDLVAGYQSLLDEAADSVCASPDDPFLDTEPYPRFLLSSKNRFLYFDILI
jgi:hypothetical protein